MARRRPYTRRRSSQQRSQGSSILIVLALASVFVLGGSVLQAMETHPFADLLALLVLGTLTGVGIVLWLRARKRHAEEAQRQYQAYLAHISTLQGLQSLTPTQFEKTIGDMMRFWGYVDVQHTGGGGDLAADLICRDTNGYITVVQCKRYATGNSVGSPEVQKFIGMIYAHHRAQYGIFVTTSDFTSPARSLAQQHNIRLIAGTELVGHVQQWRQAYQQTYQQVAAK